MESSSNMQIVDLMLHQDKQAQAYYQKRYSNPSLDDEVLNRHKMQDPFKFCQMANEQGVKTKMWSRSQSFVIVYKYMGKQSFKMQSLNATWLRKQLKMYECD